MTPSDAAFLQGNDGFMILSLWNRKNHNLFQGVVIFWELVPHLTGDSLLFKGGFRVGREKDRISKRSCGGYSFGCDRRIFDEEVRNI